MTIVRAKKSAAADGAALVFNQMRKIAKAIRIAVLRFISNKEGGA